MPMESTSSAVIRDLEKVQKRATKLVIAVRTFKHEEIDTGSKHAFSHNVFHLHPPEVPMSFTLHYITIFNVA